MKTVYGIPVDKPLNANQGNSVPVNNGINPNINFNNPTSSNHPSTDTVINMTAYLPSLPNDDCYYLYRLSKTVRLLSIIDFTFGLLMFFFGYIGFYIVFRLLCSLSGYYGAKRYDSLLSSVYLVFLIMGTLGEVFILYVYTYLFKEGKINSNALIFGIIYQCVFFLLKAYLTRFVAIFIERIKKINNDQKLDLLAYDHQPVQIIYW